MRADARDFICLPAIVEETAGVHEKRDKTETEQSDSRGSLSTKGLQTIQLAAPAAQLAAKERNVNKIRPNRDPSR